MISDRSERDSFGLSLALYNEMEKAVRTLFRHEITISEDSTARAIYFHGYLLEQTLQVFDISSLESSGSLPFSKDKKEHIPAIARLILLMPKVFIMKESFFTLEGQFHYSSISTFAVSFIIAGNSKMDRTMVTQCFDDLVEAQLLMRDYFVMTSTRRPVLCYAKALPTNDDQSELMSIRLASFGININDYIDASKCLGILPPLSLHRTGQQLISTNPYSSLTDVSLHLPTKFKLTTNEQSLVQLKPNETERIRDIEQQVRTRLLLWTDEKLVSLIGYALRSSKLSTWTAPSIRSCLLLSRLSIRNLRVLILPTQTTKSTTLQQRAGHRLPSTCPSRLRTSRER